ncbi:MAG: VOC family protein, partial [Thermoplasmatota archaeon]
MVAKRKTGRNGAKTAERAAGPVTRAPRGSRQSVSSITPFLWFDNNAEEAVKFYTSIFKNSKAGKIARYGAAGPGPKGSVATIE